MNRQGRHHNIVIVANSAEVELWEPRARVAAARQLQSSLAVLQHRARTCSAPLIKLRNGVHIYSRSHSLCRLIIYGWHLPPLVCVPFCGRFFSLRRSQKICNERVCHRPRLMTPLTTWWIYHGRRLFADVGVSRASNDHILSVSVKSSWGNFQSDI